MFLGQPEGTGILRTFPVSCKVESILPQSLPKRLLELLPKQTLLRGKGQQIINTLAQWPREGLLW